MGKYIGKEGIIVNLMTNANLANHLKLLLYLHMYF